MTKSWLLRQLAVGFGVQRLYPGAVNASAFVEAAERIRAAAEEALGAGPVAFEVRSGRFVLSGEAVTDESTQRLAQACYERRIEYLVVEHLPGRAELARWYELLSRDPHDIEEGGGIRVQLAEAEVTAIRAATGAPETASGEELPDELLGLADWASAVDEEPTQMEVAELKLAEGETPEALYARLRTLSERIVRDGSVRSRFFRRAAWLVEELPGHGSARFGRMVIDRIDQDAFAERFVGHLNDRALAMLVMDVAGYEGTSARDLAREVSLAASRHGTLQRLVDMFERRDAGEPGAGATAGQHDPEAPETAAERGAPGEVVVAADQEHASLVAAFPADDVEGRQLALTTLVDVLLSGPRREHATAILDNLTEHLHAAVRAGDAGAVEDLIAALDRSHEVADATSTALIERLRRSPLDPTVVASAAVERAREGSRLHGEVLAPFGAAAIAPTVAAVGADLTEPVARQLAELVTELGAAHPETLREEVARQRPEVIARLVPLLGVGGASLPLLARLAQRNEPEVQSAVVEAAARSSSPETSAILVTVAVRAGAGLQRRCLDILATQGAAGREQLVRLGSGAEQPRLPWTRRWLARRHARRIGGG